MSKKISIGSDHAGVEYKRGVTDTLKSLGYSVTDHGTHTTDSVDYPDFAHPVASDVETGQADFGILICGSGNGVCMTANKHQGIRAALCWTEELSALARQHNNANVLCLPARFVQLSDAVAMVKTFLSTPFEGGRHQKRVDKIGC